MYMACLPRGPFMLSGIGIGVPEGVVNCGKTLPKAMQTGYERLSLKGFLPDTLGILQELLWDVVTLAHDNCKAPILTCDDLLGAVL